jgi:hypothetical protein
MEQPIRPPPMTTACACVRMPKFLPGKPQGQAMRRPSEMTPAVVRVLDWEIVKRLFGREGPGISILREPACPCGTIQVC